MANENSRTYSDLSYYASVEAMKCDLLIKKLTALRDYYTAQSKYFEELSTIEEQNEPYNFDLSV